MEAKAKITKNPDGLYVLEVQLPKKLKHFQIDYNALLTNMKGSKLDKEFDI